MNNEIIGDLSERNLALKTTDTKPIEYEKQKNHLKKIYEEMPDNKKIVLNILTNSGWSTYKKKYLTKEEFYNYIDGDEPEPGMADSLIYIYACSTSYRQKLFF